MDIEDDRPSGCCILDNENIVVTLEEDKIKLSNWTDLKSKSLAAIDWIKKGEVDIIRCGKWIKQLNLFITWLITFTCPISDTPLWFDDVGSILWGSIRWCVSVLGSTLYTSSLSTHQNQRFNVIIFWKRCNTRMSAIMSAQDTNVLFMLPSFSLWSSVDMCLFLLSSLPLFGVLEWSHTSYNKVFDSFVKFLWSHTSVHALLRWRLNVSSRYV